MKGKNRNCPGQLGSLFALATIMTVLLIVGFGVDSIHVDCVRRQLQNAVDAAAFAGAGDLFGDVRKARDDALSVASNITVDGHRVSESIPGTTIDVSVIAPDQNQSGMVTVVSEVYVKHFLMPLVGRKGDYIQARAVAGLGGIAGGMPQNTCFPLAVSYDTVPQGNTDQSLPLSQMHIGDMFRLYIGSQKYKNAAFTSFSQKNTSASYLNAAIDQILGCSNGSPGLVPKVGVGDSINLNNGVVGQKHLSSCENSNALLAKDYLILPVISGDPPFNQSRQVKGFIAMKITSVDRNSQGGTVETITGILKRVAIKVPDIKTVSESMDNLSVHSIRLLQ